MKNKRSKHSPSFKAKVALSALQEQETVAELARRYGVHSNMVYKWRQKLLENLPKAFEAPEAAPSGTTEREAELLRKIGELTMERDFLSKGLGLEMIRFGGQLGYAATAAGSYRDSNWAGVL